jgi:hypothetical protein
MHSAYHLTNFTTMIAWLRQSKVLFAHTILVLSVWCSHVLTLQAQQRFPFQDFVGTNINREDPVQYLDACGFAREFHDWVVDEGSIFAGYTHNGSNICDTSFNCSRDYPFNTYKFDHGWQGITSENFETLYNRADAHLDNSTNSPFPVVATMKYALPRLAPGRFDNHHEGKPIETDYSITYNNLDSLPFRLPFVSGIDSAWLDRPTGATGDKCLYGNEFNFINAVRPIVSPDAAQAYTHFADWVTQYAQLHGTSINPLVPSKIHPDQQNQTRRRSDVGYIEIWNEQDKDWFNWPLQNPSNRPFCYFTPREYAAMANAAFDGNAGSMNGTLVVNDSTQQLYPLGTKGSGIRYVMAGVVDVKLSSITYVDSILMFTNRNGTNIFDVINFHHYSDNNWNEVNFQTGRGYSPENDLASDQANTPLKKRLRDIRTKYPDRELWLSEFGYDSNLNSPHKAPEIPANPQGENIFASTQETQARWLVRSYLEVASAKWDRAMQFTMRDIDSDDKPITNQGLFQSSGMVTSRASGYQPKIAYWYIQTMKNLLSNRVFGTDLHTLVSNPYSTTKTQPRVYRFDQFGFPQGQSAPSDSSVWVVWLPTEQNEKFPSGLSKPKFKLYFDGLTFQIGTSQAEIIEMQALDPDGVQAYIKPILQDTLGFYIELNEVTEKPLFVKVSQAKVIVTTRLECTSINLAAASTQGCDQVRVNWNNQFSSGHLPVDFSLYYYEQPDGIGNAPTTLDISDPNWKLYSHHIPASCNQVTIGGLAIPQDVYQVALVTYYLGSGATISNISQTTCYIDAKTGYCEDHIDVSDMRFDSLPRPWLPNDPGINPNASCLSQIFNYSDLAFCKEQRDPISAASSCYLQELEFDLKRDIQLDAIRILCGGGDGPLMLYYDTDRSTPAYTNQNNPIELTTVFGTWKSAPIPCSNQPIQRIKIVKVGPTEQVRKLILYGKPAQLTANEPMPLCCYSNSAAIIPPSANTLSAALPLMSGHDEYYIQSPTFTIDSSMTFTGKKFRFAPDVQVRIATTKGIDLQNTDLAGCEFLWNGIVGNEASRIVLNNSIIRDAKIAIETAVDPNLVVTATSILNKLPYLDIQNTIFERNGVGVKSTALSALSAIQACTFDGTLNNLKPTINSSNPRRAQAGVHLQSTYLNNIGSLVAGKGNLFLSLTQPIDIKDAVTINIYNPSIDNRDLIDLIPTFNPVGINCTNVQNVTVMQPEQNALLQGLEVAVKVFKARKSQVIGLKTKEVVTAISTQDCLDETYAANTLEMKRNGIILTNPTKFQIAGNTVSHPNDPLPVGTKPGTVGGGIGIGIHNYSDKSNTGSNIQANMISVKSNPNFPNLIGTATHLQNSMLTNVYQNTIELKNYNLTFQPTPPALPLIYGIYKNDGKDMVLCANTITGVYNNQGRGIVSFLSPGDIKCNQINATDESIYFIGDNRKLDAISGNVMDGSQKGLYVNSPASFKASLGIQELQANKWIGNGFKSAIWDGDQTFIDNSLFINKNEDPFNPPPSLVIPSTGWFETDSIKDNKYKACINQAGVVVTNCVLNQVNPPGGEGRRVLGLAYEHAQLPEPYRSMLIAKAFATTEQAYRDGTLDPEVLDFRKQFATSNMKTLTDLDFAFQHPQQANPQLELEAALYTEEILSSGIESYLNSLDNQPSIVRANAINQPPTVLFDYLQAALNLKQTVDLIEQTRNLYFQDLAASNQTFVTDNQYAELERKVNEILFQLPVTGNSIIEDNLDFIQSIAFKCPQEYGNAVLKARMLYTLHAGYLHREWEECFPNNEGEVIQGRAVLQSVDSATATSLEGITLYPVPTSGHLYVHTPHDAIGAQYQISNSVGIVIAEGVLDTKIKEILTTTMNNGFHFMQIRMPEKRPITLKFVIQKL